MAKHSPSGQSSEAGNLSSVRERKASPRSNSNRTTHVGALSYLCEVAWSSPTRPPPQPSRSRRFDSVSTWCSSRAPGQKESWRILYGTVYQTRHIDGRHHICCTSMLTADGVVLATAGRRTNVLGLSFAIALLQIPFISFVLWWLHAHNPLKLSPVSNLLVRLLKNLKGYARRKPRAIRGIDENPDLGELSHLVPCFQCVVGMAVDWSPSRTSNRKSEYAALQSVRH
jgi:hypothetical protein